MSSVAIENKDLKQQFELLQKQQQEKFLKRKQKREENQKPAEIMKSSKTASSLAFGVDDDLSLKLAEPPQQGSIYSEELVNHLQDQIREMKDETGRLYKLLSERDLELRQLRKKKETQTSAASGVTNETAATKIVELSKKVRELTAELEKEKTKAKQSLKRCFHLENELQEAQQNAVPLPNANKRAATAMVKSGNNNAVDPVELKISQDKLKQAELKVSEYRNQVLSFKKEIAMAQKVIEQEIGEGVSIQQLLNNSTGWRGRAQQIIALQRKVNDLKSQLDRSEGIPEEQDLESEMLGTSSMTASATSRTSRFKTADRHKEQLRKMEKERKENQERMAADMKALEADYDSLKSKLEASKARNKVLSNEVKTLKQQQQTFIEKGRHDDELIDALFKQQSQLKAAMEDSDKRKKEAADEKDSEIKHKTIKDMKERNLIDQLTAIVAEKESKVRILEQEIEQLKLAHLQKAQMNGVNELFDRGSRPSSVNAPSRNHIPVDYGIVEECGNLTPTFNDRRPETSHSTGTTEIEATGQFKCTTPRPTSAINNVMNAALQQEINELRIQCQEYKSLCQTATVERDKLAELIRLLQERLNEATNKTTESHTELLSIKRKNVDLEKKLGKANIEKGQSATSRRAKSKISLQSVNLEEDPFMTGDMNLEEISVQLEIQRDENEALKTALQRTLEAKEEDLKMYHQMIEETKTIFLSGLRQYRQSYPNS